MHSYLNFRASFSDLFAPAVKSPVIETIDIVGSFVVVLPGVLFSAASKDFFEQIRRPCGRVLPDFFLFFCHHEKKALEAFVGDVLVEIEAQAAAHRNAGQLIVEILVLPGHTD